LGVRKFHGGHWNKRNHRKSVIIDNNKLFFGSFNWDDCHIKSVSGKTSWRDTGACVEMTSLEVFRQSFLLAFHSSQDSRRKFVSFKAEALNVAFLAIRLNSRINERKRLNAELLSSLAQAKNYIFITTPYFAPPQNIVLALGQAAMRGVLVKVLIPGVTDVPIVKLASRRTVEALMKSGVHFFEYQKSLLHAKTYIIDSVGTIGSFNWNHRSFLHDLELSLSFEHQEVVAQLLQQWEIDLVHSQKLTNLSLNKLGSAQRVLSHFLYTFRHWL
jgi:cardiolipin synthase